MDGTLYFGDKPADGAVELIQYLRSYYQIVFFTNNSSKTDGQIFTKLNGMGFKCELSEVYTSATAAAMYLAQNRIDNVFVVGSPSLCVELENYGVTLKHSASAENLLVGLDVEFNYDKASQALDVLHRGGGFVACNLDGSYPIGDGKIMPGCGAIVAALIQASARKPDYIVGKPNTYILEQISKRFGVKNTEIAVVGDSLESDIAMAAMYESMAFLLSHDMETHSLAVVMKNLTELKQFIRRIKE